jgi:hypothetical protein
VWSSKEIMKRYSSLFLVIAVLLGQTALLEHEYDFAAHKSGDTCSICLHATPLSHAMVGVAMLAIPVVVVRSEFDARDTRVATATVIAYLARAPPAAFSA